MVPSSRCRPIMYSGGLSGSSTSSCAMSKAASSSASSLANSASRCLSAPNTPAPVSSSPAISVRRSLKDATGSSSATVAAKVLTTSSSLSSSSSSSPSSPTPKPSSPPTPPLRPDSSSSSSPSSSDLVSSVSKMGSTGGGGTEKCDSCATYDSSHGSFVSRATLQLPMLGLDRPPNRVSKARILSRGAKIAFSGNLATGITS
mmetsp:Transcript_7494/g.14106  ORF Transcript_7494/g.14106 Transcript_7494/m.14106 type:complete len:202 (+) Transcript_7494:2128-2733(+)